MVRTRFAPSPTGFVHIGSLRTALFSFLYARHMGGKHILRIEDTDQNRYVEGAVENLLSVMKQVKIEFDEGYQLKEDGKLEEKGEYGPYLQSQRLEKYKKYADKLISEKKAYFCFCSTERLEELRKEQVALKKPPMYDRFCKNLTQDAVLAKLEEFKNKGKNPVVRFAVPEKGSTTINDLIFGEVTYEHRVLDDQILIKSDGFPTYHMAVVVDDHEMEITHVIRGDEWLPSTPKHILIYQALGWTPPLHAHLPLILNTDKSKLSKRQGDVAVEDFISKGYLPEALVNFVAFLGWNPKTEQEIFSLEELSKEFDFSKVNKSPAVFDINKLDWVNSLYLRKLDSGDLTNKLLPFWLKHWQAKGIDFDKTALPHEYFEQIAMLERERLKKLSEIGERTEYFFIAPKVDPKMLVWKKSDAKDAKEKLLLLGELMNNLSEEQTTKETIEQAIRNFIQEKNFETGNVLWPMRVALTGLEKSPGPFEVASVLCFGLGKKEVVRRLSAASQML